MIAKILIATTSDGEPDATLSVAAELAAANDAELVVLTVEPLIDARRVFDPRAMAGHHDMVLDMRRDHPGLRLRTSAASGDPVRAVCEAAEHERPDLIVVGRGSWRRGGTAMSKRASRVLVDQALCTVLVVAS